MGTFFWVFLIVVPISLAEGALFALLLREVYARHPLPLIEMGYFNAWLPPKPKVEVAQPVESTPDDAADNGETAESSEIPAESADEGNAPVPSEVSVFDGAENIPQNLPVNDILDAMTTATSETVPNDFESRIDESTRLKDGLPQEMSHIKDDLDLDDLNDLEAALPKTPIDFSQEEIDPEMQQAFSPMAKELLGEHFDFKTLEQQGKETHESPSPSEETHAEESAEMTLDIQENEPGIVQVSSPLMLADSPQLANCSMPEMVLPIFSDDWIQVVEPAEEDLSNLCVA